MLDGGGQNGGTYQVLAPSGLFTATARTSITGQTVSVVAPADAVASGVSLQYVAPSISVSFTTAEATQVVRATSGEPVVVHVPIFPAP